MINHKKTNFIIYLLRNLLLQKKVSSFDCELKESLYICIVVLIYLEIFLDKKVILTDWLSVTVII